MLQSQRARRALTAITSLVAGLVASASLAPSAMAQSTVSGDLYFHQRCQACHSVAPDGKPGAVAPNLRGVVGRKAGSTAFAYSDALKASKLVWTRETLDRFLTAPMQVVPGTRMVIPVTDKAQRGVLIDWLAKQH